jgi:hypothetical protein
VAGEHAREPKFIPAIIKNNMHLSGLVATARSRMGVPETWDKVEFILNSNIVPRYPVKPVPKPFKKVWEKIPTLGNYNVGAGDDFWENFPCKPVPRNVTKRVDEKALKDRIEKVNKSLTAQQLKRADKLLDDLTWGASSYQLKEL